MSVSITGEKRPKVGNNVTYTLSGAGANIVVTEWAVYRGNLLIVEKTTGTFRFQQSSINKTYLLRAFCLDTVNNQEVVYSMALIPIAGDPKITKVWWEDCNKRILSDTKADVAYLDPLYLLIQTANIPRGDKLEITIFEDEWKKGHGDSSIKMNNKLTAIVKRNGVAEIELSTRLLEKFIKKSNDNDWMSNDAEHDYYVQIKYENKITTIEDQAQVKVKNKPEKLAPPHKGNRVVILDEENAINFVEFETGTWNVVAIERYTGAACTHNSTASARTSCRRATIRVYDHNSNVVFTFSDGLLEGTGGANRMRKNADTMLGKYLINQGANPFTSGGSRESYGPNRRLRFEPISGNGDEAALAFAQPEKASRSGIRIHGGRQENKGSWAPIDPPVLTRTHGCIRIYEADAIGFYNWWVAFHNTYPHVRAGHVFVIGNPNINGEAN